MPDEPLAGHRVLIVEDEYFLADELDGALRETGAVVIGPAASVEDALSMLQLGMAPDVALLDINLGGQLAFPVADALLTRGVPFLFTTGYDQVSLPDRYVTVRRLEKPIEARVVLRELGHLIRPV